MRKLAKRKNEVEKSNNKKQRRHETIAHVIDIGIIYVESIT